MINNEVPIKKMRWQDDGDSKVLFLRYLESDPYTRYDSPKNSRWKQQDTVLPGVAVSKGFRTAQTLLRQGWSYADTTD